MLFCTHTQYYTPLDVLPHVSSRIVFPCSFYYIVMPLIAYIHLCSLYQSL